MTKNQAIDIITEAAQDQWGHATDLTEGTCSIDGADLMRDLRGEAVSAGDGATVEAIDLLGLDQAGDIYYRTQMTCPGAERWAVECKTNPAQSWQTMQRFADKCRAADFALERDNGSLAAVRMIDLATDDVVDPATGDVI